MPSSTFEHSVHIDASPADVWDGLQSPQIWSSLGPVQEVWDPVIEDGVLTGFQWSTQVGSASYDGTGTATIQDRPDRYQLILDTSEITGTITVDLSATNPGGTDVDVTVEFRSKGFLSSMFFPMVSKAIGDGLPEQIEEMAAQLGA